MKVVADRELCIQAGNCVMVAGEVFDQDDDGIVEILREDVTDDELERVREAVRLCPASALRLEDQ
jgi:ferredoxin